VTKYPVGTCFHEAGHAVAAAALGLEVGDLHVNADGVEATVGGGVQIGFAGHLSLIDQSAVCFAGLEAELIWQGAPEDFVEFSDYWKFRELESVKCLSDKDRDKLENDGYERANELLLKNGTAVVIVAHRLVQQGYMTATEFKHLTGTLESGPCWASNKMRSQLTILLAGVLSLASIQAHALADGPRCCEEDARRVSEFTRGVHDKRCHYREVTPGRSALCKHIRGRHFDCRRLGTN